LSGRHAPRRTEPRAAGVTRARLDLLREADWIVMRAVERQGLMREIWQFPTVMLPLSIDGHGEELIILRPVLSERGMTARPAALPPALVDEIRGPILSLPGVSGLVLDLTTKPPGTIEWE
jgi:GMP synthase (glutamine-hydrolysing)